MKDWKVLKLGDEESSLVIRRAGRPVSLKIGIIVDNRDDWNGSSNSAEYFPTIEEIDLLINTLTEVKKELQENK